MNTKIEEKIKTLILYVVLFIALLSVIIAYIVFNGNYFNTNNKVNITSENASKIKIVEDVSFEKNRIINGDKISKLTTKVTNNGVDKVNMRFTAQFIAHDGTILGETTGYVGNMKTNEIKYIDSYITVNISNSSRIIYEIVE